MALIDKYSNTKLETWLHLPSYSIIFHGNILMSEKRSLFDFYSHGDKDEQEERDMNMYHTIFKEKGQFTVGDKKARRSKAAKIPRSAHPSFSIQQQSHYLSNLKFQFSIIYNHPPRIASQIETLFLSSPKQSREVV